MPSSEDAGARRAGVREVAALAGVSRQTVSRVLNEHPDVAADTRERVLRAMGQLDYRVNNAARALGTRRTWTIGVLASDMSHFGPIQGLAAVEAAARAAGYWVSTAFAYSGDEPSVLEALQHLRAQMMDGFVAFAPHERTFQALSAMDIGVPSVMLHTAGRTGDRFTVDQVAGARMAVAALADAGHERIAHLAGPTGWLEAAARLEGFHAELAARGLAPGPIFVGDWTTQSGYEAARRVRESGVTAVFAGNDQMALGLIAGLQAMGARVPEQLSVVGFDDIPDAAYSWPRLSTVRQDFEELGRRAVLEITGRSCAGLHAVPPVLVLRDSISAPRT